MSEPMSTERLAEIRERAKIDELRGYASDRAALLAEVERLTESNENLRLIANVNGDWNVKFMQEQSRTQDAIARAEAAEQTIREVSRLAMLDRKCPACSGYDAILGALVGGEQHG